MRKSLILIFLVIPFLINAQGNRPNRTEFVKYPGSRQKKEERIYKNNKLVILKQWYEDGTNKLRKSYTRTGKKNGKWAEWYSNGVKKYEIKYSNDSIIGTVFEWYEVGDVKYEKIYIDNWLYKLRYFNADKYLEYEEFYKRDENITEKIEYQWYFNKNKKHVKFYENGKLVRGVMYYPNGNIKLEEEYYYGKVDGKSISYYENGIIKSEKNYDKGRPQKFIEYNENGKVVKVVVHNKIKDKSKFK